LTYLLAAAVLEEVLFRGVAVELALSLSPALFRIAAIVISLICFAISHSALGAADITAKFSLGGLTLALTLTSGSLLPAIAAHGIFNGLTWRTALNAEIIRYQ
jgi:membrane protease YdiL (CAAX protease family)